MYIKEKGVQKDVEQKSFLNIFISLITKIKCTDSNGDDKTKIYGHEKIPFGDENEILRVLASKGPVALSMDATSDQFHLYKSGIFEFDYCTEYALNHAVLAVGYDLSGVIPYLIIKNRYKNCLF